MKLKSISLLLLSTAFSLAAANAQERLQHLDAKNGNIFENLRGQKIKNDINSDVLVKLLQLGTDNVFKIERNYTDGLGITHTNFQQYYKDVKIGGAVVMVHAKDGFIQSINGNYVPVFSLNTQINIDELRATALVQEALGITTVTRNYAPEYEIFSTDENDDMRMAYVVRMDGVNQFGGFLMKKVHIDAQNGEVLDIEELIAHTDVNATAQTVLSGTREITTDFDGVATYRLYDNARKISTLDATVADMGNGANNLFLAKEYTNNSTVWGPKPAIMSLRLSTATNDIVNGVGWSTGNFPISMVGIDTGNDLEMTSWPIFHYNSNNVPLNGRGFYYFFTPGENLQGVFGKYLSSTQDITDTISFPINTLATGTLTWSDANGNEGNYTIDSVNNPAIDAHWGIAKTYDYYVEKFSRNSYDGNGGRIINYMNGVFPMTASEGTPTQSNAMALQAPYNVMIYGLGDGVNTNPFVALDVTGHEYTHLVISRNGNGGLRYRGESGALNESFADMFGASIDFYAHPGTANWNIGDEVYISNSYMRSMSNPKLRQDPDTYKGQYWASTANNAPDNGGVHTNSSVANYWYYLVSEGGSGTNDNGYNYNVSGIGLEKAEQIAYRTLTTYLTQNSQFQRAYTGSLEAVLDLYNNDTTSAEYAAVKEAWFAVGLGEGAGTSINKVSLTNANVQVFPNPVSGAQFNINSTLSKSFEATIFNSLGQNIKTIKINNGVNTVDVSGLAKGMYNISFTIDNKTYVHKVSLY